MIIRTPKCTCVCHTEGMNVSHFMECCELTYEKYIKNGKVDLQKYNTLLNERNLIPKTPYIDGNEFVVEDKLKYI